MKASDFTKETYSDFVKWINSLTKEEIYEDYFKQGACPNRTDLPPSAPIGMYHCEICGAMVLHGLPHPDIIWRGTSFDDGWADYDMGDEYGN